MNKSTLSLSTVIFVSSLFSLFLLIYKETYNFMIWNLLLALIPLLISGFLIIIESKVKPKFLLIPIFILWLLFLPNSPYMITDFLHLSYLCKWDKNTNLYNVVTLFSGVWSGLLAGLFSTYQIHFLLKKYMKNFISWIVIFMIFILSGFGVYIGRFSRLNSWDVFQNYWTVFDLIIGYTFNLFSNPNLMEFFISITIISLLCYLTFYSIVGINLYNKPKTLEKE